MTIKTNFRGTEIGEFLRCPKRYDYRWNQQLEPKEVNEKLAIGTTVHKFLEQYYKTKSLEDANKAVESHIEELQIDFEETESADLIRSMCANYHNTFDMDKQWEILEVEKEFCIPLDDGTNYIGTIDLVVRDEDGFIWFLDHKTTNSIDLFDKNSNMDRQISRYWWALEQLGYGVHGFIYNILLKDYPQPPKQLKSGALSKDKSQRTTAEMYRQAISDNNLKIEDYQDFLDYLEQFPREYFRRVKVERGALECLAAIDEMEDVILDIRDKQANGRWYRNITKDCSWDCPFKSLCQAEMDGSNADHIRAELFQVKV